MVVRCPRRDGGWALYELIDCGRLVSGVDSPSGNYDAVLDHSRQSPQLQQFSLSQTVLSVDWPAPISLTAIRQGRGCLTRVQLDRSTLDTN